MFVRKALVREGYRIDHGKTGEKFFSKYGDLQRFLKVA
jgi:hypothetical protein